MTLCVIGRVRFERNCGKMYSRHLFPYGGLFQGSLLGTSPRSCGSLRKLTWPSFLVSKVANSNLNEDQLQKTLPNVIFEYQRFSCFYDSILNLTHLDIRLDYKTMFDLPVPRRGGHHWMVQDYRRIAAFP